MRNVFRFCLHTEHQRVGEMKIIQFFEFVVKMHGMLLGYLMDSVSSEVEKM